VIWLAIVFALTSAFFTALSTSVQHQAAGAAPDSVGGLWHLLWHLTQRPVWVLGQALGIAGFITHALAVIHGPISLVQPIIITGIVFAVPIRAAISRRLPEPREMGAVFLTAGALAIFLLASDPSEGDGHPGGLAFFFLVAGCASLGVLVFVLTRLVRTGNLRAFLLGASAGLLLGLVAVLVKAAEEEYDKGGLSHLLTTWPIYGLACAGLGGVAINQVAYRSARLSASMPMLNVVNCLVGLSFGYLVFQEVPRHTPWAIGAELVGLAVLCTGLWLLANYEEQHEELIELPVDGADRSSDQGADQRT
jgi:drug/metabolite transporter (DMT)-like permease